ncbi:hypothetical protein CLOM_g7901 [Closterium sp. NIES-68]|nr:hypothetical protein CLOM_g24108 [Closterium sp. NIES-68]GJP48610.1 hypothetical protein CLOM_g7901 [Closterium sp. NIES-68]GJP58237.1 hypothetical protein CLOP_g22703 [Closterium sp. NIES-67]
MGGDSDPDCEIPDFELPSELPSETNKERDSRAIACMQPRCIPSARIRSLHAPGLRILWPGVREREACVLHPCIAVFSAARAKVPRARRAVSTIGACADRWLLFIGTTNRRHGHTADALQASSIYQWEHGD